MAIKNITDRISDFDFDLITARFDNKLPEHEKMGNISVFRVGGSLCMFGSAVLKIFLPLAIFFKAINLIKNNSYCLVHAFQASHGAGAGWLLKFLYPKLPFVVTLQEGKNLDSQGLLINFFRGLILRKADHATAISQYLKNLIARYNKTVHVSVIPNGVNVEAFSKQFSYGDLTFVENKLGISPDDFVVISTSRLVEKNGIDVLVGSLKFLKDLVLSRKFKLLLLGEGSLKESLKFQVKSLKLERDVIFAGTINNDELPIYLKIADVFVRPSRSEGLGTAFLEAMAAGVPIIGTKVGGIPDFLKDGETGLFCKVDDANDIADKIKTLLNDNNLRDKLKDNGRRLVLEKYNWDNIARQFGELYKRIGK